MGRRNVRSKMAHTPLSPSKNRIRRDWLKDIHNKNDVITISHGVFDVLMILGWRGIIFPCDKDSGVRESIGYMIENYPDLLIANPLSDIDHAVQDYCSNFGTHNLGAVDVDLTATLPGAFSILKPVLLTLIMYHFSGKVIFTFSAGRDSFNSLETRMAFLSEKLPAKVSILSYQTYQSVRINEFGGRNKGSAMCCVVLKHRR